MAKIEKIDQKILNLVGIFDYEAEMDYDEYISLLRERMTADRMGQKVDSADASDIRDEWKRVKGKKGRFKVGLKERAKKFVNGGEQKLLSGTQFTKLDNEKILPSGKMDGGGVKNVLNVKQQINPWESISKSINDIQNSINGIANILNKKNKIERAQQRVGFKISNAAKRDKKENELENKGIKAVKNIASKVMKPVKSFWDSIWNFFKWILLGSAVNKILEIIKDPEIILKPLRDFVNGIIDFLNGLMENIFNFFATPFNLLIDGINNGVGFLYDRMNDIRSLVSNLPGVNLEPVEKPERINYVEKPDWLENMKIERWEKDDDKVQKLAGGGVTSNSGKKITGMGPDTQLIAAQPGEVVMSKKAVDHWGRDNLLSMNKEGGGTNISSFGSGPIQRMSDGGVVIGAGHAPSKDPRLRALHLGDDQRSVGGTRESAGRGVYEWQATEHLVNTLKRMIPNTSIADRVSFEDITTWNALRTLPASVEARDGRPQFVDFHFDARGNGRPGVLLPHQNQISAIDRAFLGVFGKYPGIEPHEKGITDVGGTIVELERINHPALRPFLREVEQKKVSGPASEALATKVINPLIQGLGATPQSPINSPLSPTSASIVPNTLNTASGISQVNSGGSGPRIVFVGGGDGGDQSNSSADANQNVPSTFSSTDSSNTELIVIKSIYNIVG